MFRTLFVDVALGLAQQAAFALVDDALADGIADPVDIVMPADGAGADGLEIG